MGESAHKQTNRVSKVSPRHAPHRYRLQPGRLYDPGCSPWKEGGRCGRERGDPRAALLFSLHE